jgi:hypothetical protein
MSGRKSSERQWVSGRVRALLAVLLALSMLIPMAISAYADNGTTVPVTPTPEPKDKVCVTGSVITWDEYPLPDPYPELEDEDKPQDYWNIVYYPVRDTSFKNVTTTNYDPDFDTAAEKAMFKVDPGNLNAGESWVFEIELQNEWEPVTPISMTVPIPFGETKCQQIRFKLKRPVPVTVYKIDDLHNPLKDWEMKASPAKDNWFAIPVTGTTNEMGATPLLRLTDGMWNFTEKAPKDTTYHPIMPPTGEQDLRISWTEWAYGGKDPTWPPLPPEQREKVQLRFKNYITERGCIEAYKYDVPPEQAVARGEPDLYPGAFGLPDWMITLKKANGQVVATKYTDATGKVKFENLAFGPYTVVEERQNGWAPATPTTFEVMVSSNDDNCQEVEFYNKQDWPYCIEGRKIDTNGKVGLPGWKITIRPLDKGGAEADADNVMWFEDEGSKVYTFTDGLGKYRFNFPKDDYRVPGAKYEVCEEEKDGWLPHTSLCQTVYVPTHPGACAKAWDFENQQVGHWETVVYGRPSEPTSDGSCTYVTAQPGDSLCGIGAAYGVSCGAMFSANPWIYSRPNHYLYSGDQVCVP